MNEEGNLLLDDAQEPEVFNTFILFFMTGFMNKISYQMMRKDWQGVK